MFIRTGTCIIILNLVAVIIKNCAVKDTLSFYSYLGLGLMSGRFQTLGGLEVPDS